MKLSSPTSVSDKHAGEAEEEGSTAGGGRAHVTPDDRPDGEARGRERVVAPEEVSVRPAGRRRHEQPASQGLRVLEQA